MDALQTAVIQCPYCWESIELVIDCSVTEQQYVEDCEVCCRPIVVSVKVHGDGAVQVEGWAEND